MTKMKHPPQTTRFLRLPFDFDVSALQQDLQRLQQLQNPVWLDHYNNTAHQKRWACLPLRSLGGSTQDIFAQNEGNFLDTPLLAACPYFQQVLARFACQTTSVRLMTLAAGGRILPHTDPGGGFEDGVARLHIPIITDPRVVFYIDGETIHFSAGHTWYMNANCTHAVDNASAIERIHLVIDCIPNDWLKQVFIDAGWQQNAPPKYGDPNITDDNVADIIAALRNSGSSTNHDNSGSDNTQALQLAEQLTMIQARHST